MGSQKEKGKESIQKIPINVGAVVAVASGKGGVGKSTVTVNLALSLAAAGKKVGLLDADIYGPNVPLMLGLEEAVAQVTEAKLIPVEKHRLKVMSVGFIAPPEKALIWRGPLANKLVEQFLRDVKWDSLDILLIDLPPGTGDVPLSIIQKAELSAGIVVTTPQEAAIADVRKMLNMFEATNTRVLGIVENMKYIVCPHCSKQVELYPGQTKKSMSKQLGYKVLAELPFEPQIGIKDKQGQPYYLTHKDTVTTKEYDKLAQKVLSL
jgi:ATP-binding protein involved in chromosome partitioning